MTESSETPKTIVSDPIGIPLMGKHIDESNHDSNKGIHTHAKRLLEEEHFHQDNNHKVGSPHSNTDDEDHPRLPDGSPAFESVMSELHINCHTKHIHEDHKIPISPLASSGNEDDIFSHEPVSVENVSPSAESPTTPKKRLGSATSSKPRDRSYSWNYRNKMAAERRKQLQLQVPHHTEPRSPHSSPLINRKKKAISQPSTPKLLHVQPKFKILTENISVSHEDLVKEQARERHLAEGFSEVKSIFHSQKYDRLGTTPDTD